MGLFCLKALGASGPSEDVGISLQNVFFVLLRWLIVIEGRAVVGGFMRERKWQLEKQCQSDAKAMPKPMLLVAEFFPLSVSSAVVLLWFSLSLSLSYTLNSKRLKCSIDDSMNVD